MKDADLALASSRRPLVIGIGGRRRRGWRTRHRGGRQALPRRATGGRRGVVGAAADRPRAGPARGLRDRGRDGARAGRAPRALRARACAAATCSSRSRTWRRSSASSISAAPRGPGSGSIGRRSHATPPTIGRAPWERRPIDPKPGPARRRRDEETRRSSSHVRAREHDVAPAHARARARGRTPGASSWLVLDDLGGAARAGLNRERTSTRTWRWRAGAQADPPAPEISIRASRVAPGEPAEESRTDAPTGGQRRPLTKPRGTARSRRASSYAARPSSRSASSSDPSSRDPAQAPCFT